MPSADVEVLLPVDNEAESIESTFREIYRELSVKVKACSIVCEDGSKDNTQETLGRLSRELPMCLNLSEGHKGYSRAIREGMRMLESEYQFCLDSNGQCDPKDFWAFWEARDSADVVMGWRAKRAETFMRQTFSRFSYLIYQAVLRTPVHEPSRPCLLIRRAVA